jgi:hypothetical protein
LRPTGERVALIAVVTDDLIGRGVRADALVREVAKLHGRLRRRPAAHGAGRRRRPALLATRCGGAEPPCARLLGAERGDRARSGSHRARPAPMCRRRCRRAWRGVDAVRRAMTTLPAVLADAALACLRDAWSCDDRAAALHLLAADALLTYACEAAAGGGTDASQDAPRWTRCALT